MQKNINFIEFYFETRKIKTEHTIKMSKVNSITTSVYRQ